MYVFTFGTHACESLPAIEPTLACSVLGTLGYFHMTCMCSALCPVSEHRVMFSLSLPLLFLQTGEFSACFLLKLPVDFSNIPVYLLKVMTSTHTRTLPYSYEPTQIVYAGCAYTNIGRTCKRTNGRLTCITKNRESTFVWWVCAKCALCMCVCVFVCVCVHVCTHWSPGQRVD